MQSVEGKEQHTPESIMERLNRLEAEVKLIQKTIVRPDEPMATSTSDEQKKTGDTDLLSNQESLVTESHEAQLLMQEP
ncbi:unnamed protein product [Acanthoscelides obtectus]|uniref:Uncharacterized protein n=1 Tax=Acanthoscelides obtectus TaxID=200917 RepID=A0A9P0PQP2_ACAOB|nr:unnamed protein product [Acanthoscelides obtectus]CAK1639001.1 hypothetical protein AOBTE_LOCUS10936 [Acanthoscelides obtectus]